MHTRKCFASAFWFNNFQFFLLFIALLCSFFYTDNNASVSPSPLFFSASLNHFRAIMKQKIEPAHKTIPAIV